MSGLFRRLADEVLGGARSTIRPLGTTRYAGHVELADAEDSPTPAPASASDSRSPDTRLRSPARRTAVPPETALTDATPQRPDFSFPGSLGFDADVPDRRESGRPAPLESNSAPSVPSGKAPPTSLRRNGGSVSDASTVPWVDEHTISVASRPALSEPVSPLASRSEFRQPKPLVSSALATRPPTPTPRPDRTDPPAVAHGADDEPAEVHIHIGRIEVTAVHEATPPKRSRKPSRKPMNLDDYLSRREGGSR